MISRCLFIQHVYSFPPSTIRFHVPTEEATGCTISMTLRNLTVDDFNNSTLISYHPPLCNGSGWTVNKQGGYSGTYTYCTSSNDTLSANISFTGAYKPSVALLVDSIYSSSHVGVAVYYVSQNFEGRSMRFKLDGALSNDVNLSTPSGLTVNTSSTRIIWKQTGLENKIGRAHV